MPEQEKNQEMQAISQQIEEVKTLRQEAFGRGEDVRALDQQLADLEGQKAAAMERRQIAETEKRAERKTTHRPKSGPRRRKTS